MFKHQACLLLSVLSAAASSLAQTSSAAPAEVKLRLTESVSSATARAGQHVSLEVADPVVAGGAVIIPAGAHADAIVSEARRRGHNRREGKLLLTFQTVTLPNGTQARLLSAPLRKGGAETQPIFGPCTFPFPADPVGLFRHGPNVEIPKGTELTATLAYPPPQP